VPVVEDRRSEQGQAQRTRDDYYDFLETMMLPALKAQRGLLRMYLDAKEVWENHDDDVAKEDLDFTVAMLESHQIAHGFVRHPA
jgi:hypothetical protein